MPREREDITARELGSDPVAGYWPEPHRLPDDPPLEGKPYFRAGEMFRERGRGLRVWGELTQCCDWVPYRGLCGVKHCGNRALLELDGSTGQGGALSL